MAGSPLTNVRSKRRTASCASNALVPAGYVIVTSPSAGPFSTVTLTGGFAGGVAAAGEAERWSGRDALREGPIPTAWTNVTAITATRKAMTPRPGDAGRGNSGIRVRGDDSVAAAIATQEG